MTWRSDLKGRPLVRCAGSQMTIRLGAALAAGLLGAPALALGASGTAAGAPARGPASPAAGPAASSAAAPRARAIRPVAGPRLSNSVTDGRAEVAAGDHLTYVITVRNAGTAAVPRLTVTQTLPPGMRLTAASHGGVPAAGKITWHVAVPAGRAVVVTASEQVTRIPAGQLRLAAVACAGLPGRAAPAVCAADLNDTVATAEAAARARAAGTAGGRSWTGYAVGGGVLLACAGTLAALRRRMTRRQSRAGRRLT
jgi:uncharacterized repeat protein (TIGR01451 family)